MTWQDERERQEEDDYLLWKEQKRRHDPHYDGHGLAADHTEMPKPLPALTCEEYLAKGAEYQAQLLKEENEQCH